MNITITITNQPDQTDDEVISTGLQQYKKTFSSGSFEPLSVYCLTEDENIIGGLIGVTFGGWLHVSELWVSEDYRGRSLGSTILIAAENEAISRSCIGSTLDTYSFQSLEFYLKLGYSQFGSLTDYAGKYERHYLEKRFVDRRTN